MVVGRELLICIGTYWKDEETGTTSRFSIGATIVGTGTNNSTTTLQIDRGLQIKLVGFANAASIVRYRA